MKDTCWCTACKPEFSFTAGVLKLIITTFIPIHSVVSSLCYQTSVTSNRVVLDGFLTYQSSTTACSCTLTSSKSTTVRFAALNNLHPIHAGCGSNIRVQAGETVFTINCYVSGTVQVSPSQPATLSFDKPSFGYDSNYCALLNPGKQTK